MPDIEIKIGLKVYRLACESGQEVRLQQAAARIDAYANRLISQFKTLSEERLLLMSALMLADDLLSAEENLENTPTPNDQEDLELLMANLLKTATLRLKDIQQQIILGVD